MKLRVTLSDGRTSTDIEITAEATASAGDVARGIARADPRHGPGAAALDERTLSRLTLAVAGRTGSRHRVVPPGRPLGEAGIANGALVRVVLDEGAAEQAPAAVLRVVNGPDAGREWPLPFGDAVIGRDPSCQVHLTDRMVSAHHARLIVRERVELVDLNSANGILVDGQIVPRVELASGVRAVLGETELQVEALVPGAQRAESGSPVHAMRPPVVTPRFETRELAAPSLPTEKDKPRFPFLSLVAPVVMGLAMFFITKQPFSLLFVAMAPVMMAGSWVDGRSQRTKQLRSEAYDFESGMAELQGELEELRGRERAVRQAEAPAGAEVAVTALRDGRLVWSRRAEHWNALHVRLGTGSLPSRVRVAAADASGRVLADPKSRLDALIAHYRTIDGVPVVESLADAGGIGVVGDRERAASCARDLVVQLTGLHPPADLELAAIVGPDWAGELASFSWLPHANDTAVLGDAHLADSPIAGLGVLAALEGLLQARSAQREALAALASDGAAEAHGADVVRAATRGTPEPAILVVVAHDAPVDPARLIDLAERGPSAGIHVLWLAPSLEEVPGACRTFVDVSAGLERARIGRVRAGDTVDAVVDGMPLDRAAAFAERLAGVVDASARSVESGDLPRSVPLVRLIGADVAESPAGVVERWRQNESIAQRGSARPTPPSRRGSLRALVGSTGVDAMHLDLRTDGPHALVGGTTGAGKSEFLQAWVLGMAAGYSPDRATFLFVDYKGGSAFGECVALPHCVGLVTDLSPRLVRRALTSLRAELHHREVLLRDAGAKDLEALERRGDPAAPPALVIVIDEFAALATDVPEFVDGVVDIAQRGRSLGIHLIMATQRPAGVIRDNLRANTNLRIALRMADAHDSQDVVGESTAAGFDPATPGRAVAKRGPGRLVPFQSAYAGGRSGAVAVRAEVHVSEFRFGGRTPWQEPKSAVRVEESGPTDIERVVTTIGAAAEAAGIPAPRRPWLDELPVVLPLERLAPRADDAIVIGLADDPAHQSRETVSFRPDAVGHLAIFGTGGSGKSTVLRTLAASAAVTPDGGPVDVYALDMAGGALRMLRQLPHVSSVIAGDDVERATRLMRVLRDELDRRARLFSEATAGTIAEYRAIAHEPRLPRILLLLDGFPAFRDEFEGPLSGGAYATFMRLLQEGRQVGIHVALTADRAGSVPSIVSSAIQQRVVLRQADETGYQLLDAPRDVLGESSPPGRAVVGDLEVQIAVLGGSANPADQAAALADLAEAQRRLSGRADHEWPAPVVALPSEIEQASLPASTAAGKPVLGLAEDTLQPLGFDASGVLLVAGPPASGRTNALAAIAESIRRWDAGWERHLLCAPRSQLVGRHEWTSVSAGVDDVAARARELSARIAEDAADEGPGILVVLEEIGDWLQSSADPALVELIKRAKRSRHLFVADGDTSSWVSSWPLMSEIKSARRGVLLQPDPVDGDTILRTPIPRGSKVAPPPGRGVAVLDRRAVRLQLPLAPGTPIAPRTAR